MKNFLLPFCFALALLPVTLVAQQDDPVLTEMLENFFRDNEGASESDAQVFIERLELLRQNPLDLNTATREDLRATQLLTDLQTEALVTYRQQLGPLLNIYELQAIPHWEADDIRRLRAYFEIGTGTLDVRARPLQYGLLHGDNELLVRAGRNVPTRFVSNAEGGPFGYALRYRHNFDGRLRYGFTAENDAGEAFFNKSNSKGFDFYSAHFFINNPTGRTLRTLALGDFTARMGQGLLLQTGFSPGKSAESVNALLRGGNRIGAYGAFGEAYFLRGAGAMLALGRHLDLQVLASRRQRDASIDTLDADTDEVRFSSIIASGLHRTPSEIAKERAITETMLGAALLYHHRNGHIGANVLQIAFDQPFEPTFKPYRRYQFTGKQLLGLSLDYQQRWGNRVLFGEVARSENGGIAALNGLLLALDRRVSMGLIHRYFEPEYQAIYAAPFAESSGANNEQGLYAGLEVRPAKPWRINAYADLWRHPWLRFSVDGPSSGRDYLLRLTWQPRRGFETYALVQTEKKQTNGQENGLVDTERTRMRLHVGYKIGAGTELRSRVEWVRIRTESFPVSKGFMAYQEAVVKPRGSRWSGAARYALFDTDAFDSRVFAFENDLFSAVSIPGFSGRGNRFYVNLTFRASKAVRLEGRYETTYLERAVTSGTQPGRQSVIKTQLLVRF